eukprot:TRINITY_DN48996_c0_g1_i1.p1 TRINITY_DN48996_c0_g1~~TRINITY_DN48996_c0_g1_i1.p1  ORF type:complete len:1112 (-),score=250.29 TRINITY_DN48996_c0_g1_i1:188-3523(-)
MWWDGEDPLASSGDDEDVSEDEDEDEHVSSSLRSVTNHTVASGQVCQAVSADMCSLRIAEMEEHSAQRALEQLKIKQRVAERQKSHAELNHAQYSQNPREARRPQPPLLFGTGDVVSFDVTSLPHHLQYLRRMPNPTGTVIHTRSWDGTALVRLQDGNHQWFDTCKLVKSHPILQPAAPALDYDEQLAGGFRRGDYVRHRDKARDFGKGVIQGPAPRTIENSEDVQLLVRVAPEYAWRHQSFGHSANGAVPFSVDDLMVEAAWHKREAERLETELPALVQTVRSAGQHLEMATSKVHEMRLRLALKQAEQRKVSKALKNATKDGQHQTTKVVTSVKFPDGIALPTAWRDISKCVSYEWSVAVSRKSEDEQKQVLLSVHDMRAIAREVKESGIPGEHIISAKGAGLQELAKGPRKPANFSLGVREAKVILKHSKMRADLPNPLHSFSLLKAALGAFDDGVVLHPRLQEFFDGPETGIVRAKEVPVPDVLSNTLRGYQQTGFQWLVNNAKNGLGCILADDMGLGKTIQALTFIMYMKREGLLEHPVLIVVPKGLLSNWEKETAKWAPELKVHTYYGQQRKLLSGAAPKVPAAEAGSASAPATPATRAVAKAPGSLRSPVSTDKAAAASKRVPEAPDDTLAVPTKRRRITSKQKVDDMQPVGKEVGVAASSGSSSNFSTTATPAVPKPRRTRKAVLAEAPADIFLTSYGTLRGDVAKLATGQIFSGMILDEAQQIKNYSSQISKAVKRMAETTGSIRVALSGTPVENRLSDLHSQFEFILPGYLAASRQEFDRDFGKPLTSAVRNRSSELALEKQRLLQRMVQPFVLRRLKTDPNIASDLPPKVEQDHYCELSDAQTNLYKAVQEVGLNGIGGADGAFARAGQVLATLHALREVCNHPTCLAEKRRPQSIAADLYPLASNTEASGKCAKLHELLEQIMQANEKVLIFTSYLSTLAMLAEQIQLKWNTQPLRIEGSMSKAERDLAVERFQTDPSCGVLLLSLQAGGVGLTLTAATHVIHFDRCYNPARENQATDRAHRIGQKKTVFVHRLTTKDTFEERLGEIMEEKQKLSDLTVQSGEGWIADLGDAELRELFSLSGNNNLEGNFKKKRVAEPF